MRRRRLPLVLLLLVTSLAALPAAAHAFTSFQSPSGNIGCFIDRKLARCDISKKDWTAPKPRGCQLDYGRGLSIARGARKGRSVCAGDTTLGSGRKLGYGKSIRRKTIRCRSSEAGMRCTNGRGHGFFISKQRYKLF